MILDFHGYNVQSCQRDVQHACASNLGSQRVAARDMALQALLRTCSLLVQRETNPAIGKFHHSYTLPFHDEKKTKFTDLFVKIVSKILLYIF